MPAANDPGSKPTLEPLRPGNLKPKALKALKNQGLEAYNTRQNLSLSPKSPKAQSPKPGQQPEFLDWCWQCRTIATVQLCNHESG